MVAPGSSRWSDWHESKAHGMNALHPVVIDPQALVDPALLEMLALPYRLYCPKDGPKDA